MGRFERGKVLCVGVMGVLGAAGCGGNATPGDVGEGVRVEEDEKAPPVAHELRVLGGSPAIAVDDAGRAVAAFISPVEGVDNAFMLRASVYEPETGWSAPRGLADVVGFGGVEVAASPGGFIAIYAAGDPDGTWRVAARRWLDASWGPERTIATAARRVQVSAVEWGREREGLAVWNESGSDELAYVPAPWRFALARIADDGAESPALVDLPHGAYPREVVIARWESGWRAAHTWFSAELEGAIGVVTCPDGAPCVSTSFRDGGASIASLAAHEAGATALVARSEAQSSSWAIAERTPDGRHVEIELGANPDVSFRTIAANGRGDRLVSGTHGDGYCTNSLALAEVTATTPVATRVIATEPGLGVSQSATALTRSGRGLVVWGEGDEPWYSDCGPSVLRALYRDGASWSAPFRIETVGGRTFVGLQVVIAESGRGLVAYHELGDPWSVVAKWVEPVSR